MAVTTGARFGLTNWSAGTDKPTRVQANNDHGLLEAKGAIRIEQPLASRPAAGMGGVLFLATDTHVAYWDNGAGWEVIGRVTEGTRTVKLTTGQVANLDEFRDATGTLLSFVDKVGKFNGPYADSTYPAWVKPSTGLKPNWSEYQTANYPLAIRRSGDFVAIRGALLVGAGATSVAFVLDAPYIPLNTQFFACWSYNGGASYLTGKVDTIAVVVGSADTSNFFGVSGTLALFGTNSVAIPVTQAIHLNVNYLVAR